LSLQLGEYPTEWKKANIIPIYQKENRQHKNNYRPVALLSSISKIQEKIVFKNLYDFLINVDILNKFQSGFRPGDGIGDRTGDRDLVIVLLINSHI
jgi:hypothetical protein